MASNYLYENSKKLKKNETLVGKIENNELSSDLVKIKS